MDTGLYIGPDNAPDRYRLLRSIGRGGEAVLYLAELELSGATEPVVVKVLDARQTLSQEMFSRISAKWQEQAELLRFVHRLGVVGIREHFEGPSAHPAGRSTQEGSSGGRALYLVMNHVEGLDLRDWRAERSLESPAERREAVRCLEQLADVLDWLHSGAATPSGRTVVHGDLSPGNVMIDANGQATLVDFGLSKLTADHQTAEVWFTPGFAAPEVFEGKRTPASDRYAFGAIAYFLLSGESPATMPETLRAALLDLPELVALDGEKAARIAAVFANDPAGRPDSLAAWVKELRPAVISTTTRQPKGPAKTARAAGIAGAAAVPPPPAHAPGSAPTTADPVVPPQPSAPPPPSHVPAAHTPPPSQPPAQSPAGGYGYPPRPTHDARPAAAPAATPPPAAAPGAVPPAAGTPAAHPQPTHAPAGQPPAGAVPPAGAAAHPQPGHAPAGPPAATPAGAGPGPSGAAADAAAGGPQQAAGQPRTAKLPPSAYEPGPAPLPPSPYAPAPPTAGGGDNRPTVALGAGAPGGGDRQPNQGSKGGDGRRRGRKPQIVLAAVVALLLVGGGAYAGVKLSGAGAKDNAASHAPTRTQNPPASPAASAPSSDPGDGTSADGGTPTDGATGVPTMSPGTTEALTSEDPADSSQNLLTQDVAVNGKQYYDALVTEDCYGGYAEYDLGRKWTTFSVVLGVDDTGKDAPVRFTVKADGNQLFQSQVALGKPSTQHLDVTGALRLRIEWEVTDDEVCGTGVLADPQLSN